MVWYQCFIFFNNNKDANLHLHVAIAYLGVLMINFLLHFERNFLTVSLFGSKSCRELKLHGNDSSK